MLVCGWVLLFLRVITLCLYKYLCCQVTKRKGFFWCVCLDQSFFRNHSFLMQASSCTSNTTLLHFSTCKREVLYCKDMDFVKVKMKALVFSLFTLWGDCYFGIWLLIFWKWAVLDTQSQRIGARQPGRAPASKVSSAGSFNSFAKTDVFISLLSVPPSLDWGSVGRIRSITSIFSLCKFLLWEFWTGITVVKYSCIFSS